MFTTRPEIHGTFGVVTSTHWMASATGMAMLEKGGNAFDACIAAAFVLQLVEPHLVGPSGDMPAVFYSARTKQVEVLCAQGPSPEAATIAAYKALGLDLVPGSGLLATVVPGAFDGWMLMLRDHGRLSLREVLSPAIGYALNGHPMLPRVADQIRAVKDLFETEWPTSAAVFLPGGALPKAQALFANPTLGATYARILAESEAAGGSREHQIEAARRSWSQGFVAEAIDRFCRTQEVMDSSGRRHKGLLTGHDMARWSASYEKPASISYHGWEVFKTGPWGQGPLFLQTLKILEGFDLNGMDPKGAPFIHLVAEALKLAFADREAYYGDPDFVSVPMETLLSEAYAAERRALISEAASVTLRLRCPPSRPRCPPSRSPPRKSQIPRQRPPCACDAARHDRACDTCRHVRSRDRPKSRYSSSSRRPRPQSAALNAAQGPSRGVRIARVQEDAPRSR